MVELIVVMILVGILGAIGAARFFDRTGFDTAGFADQVGAMLRFGQKVAIAQRRPVIARFDGESIRLCYDSACASPVRAPFAVTTDATYCKSGTAYCILHPQEVGYTVSLGTAAPATSLVFAFDGLGRPVDAASAAPLAAAVTVSVNPTTGSSTTVSIEPETGYVH